MPNPDQRRLICGCGRYCACVCPAHSPTRRERLCLSHLALWVVQDAAGIVSLALFVCTVAVWAAIVGGR